MATQTKKAPKEKILVSLDPCAVEMVRHVSVADRKDVSEIVNELIVEAFAGRTFSPMASAS